MLFSPRREGQFFFLDAVGKTVRCPITCAVLAVSTTHSFNLEGQGFPYIFSQPCPYYKALKLMPGTVGPFITAQKDCHNTCSLAKFCKKQLRVNRTQRYLPTIRGMKGAMAFTEQEPASNSLDRRTIRSDNRSMTRRSSFTRGSNTESKLYSYTYGTCRVHRTITRSEFNAA